MILLIIFGAAHDMAVPDHSAGIGNHCKPACVTFQTRGSDYVYDAATNTVSRLTGRIHGYARGTAVEPLAGLRRRRLLQPLPQRNYRAVLDPVYLEGQYSGQLNQLVLHLTEQCNQRCSYCVNSGKYLGEYTHNNRRMTWDIARRCIDYFVPRTATDTISGIGFFGGEPLLCWDVIEKSVRYVKKNYALMTGMPLTVATNLTLLEPRQLDFLVRNGVGLQVSLDGPPEIHDAARVTAAGLGTHAAVVAKLGVIRRTHPRYYAERVSINCVLSPANDPSVVFDYFNSREFAGTRIRVNPVKEDDSGTYAFSPESSRRYEAGLDRIVESYLSSFESPSDFNCRLFEQVFINVFYFLRQMGTAPVHDDHPFNIVCLPGVKNLYVSADGTFYPCEQFRCQGCEIGDYRTGFDTEKIRRLMVLMADYCAENCQDCWAWRLCGHCWLHLMDRGQISEKRKAQRCVREIEDLLRALCRFVDIWGREPPQAYRRMGSLHFLERSSRLLRAGGKNRDFEVRM